ncbi:MAG: NADH-quinone oxidoreductase subunit I [Chlorobi bacterium]|nr:NADH-quinone oxidoreductase subunit I [Chlorobiota bacterium]
MGNYFKAIYNGIGTALVGMGVTWRHLWGKKVTIQYPTQTKPRFGRSRDRLYVNIEDCIGCDQCAKACPVYCIHIETIKAAPGVDLGKTSTGHKKRLHVSVFDIDFAKCCYCGLCVYPCPTECITMTDVFEFSEYERRNLLYHFSAMTEEEVAKAKEEAERAEAEKARKKAEAAAAAKAKKEAENAAKAKEEAGQSQAQASDAAKPEDAKPTSGTTSPGNADAAGNQGMKPEDESSGPDTGTS